MKPPTIAKLRRQVAEFNGRHSIGTTVHFHPVIGQPAHRVTKTASEAWILGDHTAVVKLEKVPGCVALDAITEAPPAPATVRLVKDSDCPVCGWPEVIIERYEETGGLRPGAIVSIECGQFAAGPCPFKWRPL